MTDLVHNIDVNAIESVYSGVNGKCCCGCSGKHSIASSNAEEATRRCGYDMSDSVSDRTVRQIVNKLNKLGAVEEDSCFYAVDRTSKLKLGRLYIAYKAAYKP